MISRKTAMAVAQAYTEKFSYREYSGRHAKSVQKVYNDSIYDFLYEREYEAWFCNATKKIYTIRGLKEWFLKVHTGETLSNATPDWPWKKREALGEQYLKNLAQDFLIFYMKNAQDKWTSDRYKTHYEELVRRLEIDGYIFKDSTLYQSEADVLNVEEEANLLEKLFDSLGLSDKEITFKKKHPCFGYCLKCSI